MKTATMHADDRHDSFSFMFVGLGTGHAINLRWIQLYCLPSQTACYMYSPSSCISYCTTHPWPLYSPRTKAMDICILHDIVLASCIVDDKNYSCKIRTGPCIFLSESCTYIKIISRIPGSWQLGHGPRAHKCKTAWVLYAWLPTCSICS